MIVTMLNKIVLAMTLTFHSGGIDVTDTLPIVTRFKTLSTIEVYENWIKDSYLKLIYFDPVYLWIDGKEMIYYINIKRNAFRSKYKNKTYSIFNLGPWRLSVNLSTKVSEKYVEDVQILLRFKEIPRICDDSNFLYRLVEADEVKYNSRGLSTLVPIEILQDTEILRVDRSFF